MSILLHKKDGDWDHDYTLTSPPNEAGAYEARIPELGVRAEWAILNGAEGIGRWFEEGQAFLFGFTLDEDDT